MPPRCSGLDALGRLTPQASVRTILLTGTIRPSEMVTALKLGARGILLKDASSTTLTAQQWPPCPCEGRNMPFAPMLGDLIDAASVQSLMADFYNLTRLPMAVVDTEGRVLVGVGWQD